MPDAVITDFIPVKAIIDFWFGGDSGNSNLIEQKGIWFNGGSDLDLHISSNFGPLFDIPELQNLNFYSTANESLAAILVFDQFSRNCFRGTAKAFSFDKYAIQIMDLAIKNQWDRALHPVKASFLYMPLQHAESLERQEQGVTLFESLASRLSGENQEPYREMLINTAKYARDHHAIIRQFGRFPHRNDVMGRASTREETFYLEAGGARFGQ